MATMFTSEGLHQMPTSVTVGAAAGEADAAADGQQRHGFSPYSWNGGTVVAIGGDDYCVLAADKRLAQGYNILSRNVDRVFKMSDETMISAGGSHNDVVALYDILDYKKTMYKFDHGDNMGTVAAAQLVSNTLYYRRFFPLYSLCVVAGVDADGKGYCAGYDAVGSYIRSRDNYTANGSAAAIAMPVLDNALGQTGVSSGLAVKPKYSAKEAVEMIKDVFITVGERDILCGDAVDIYVMRKGKEVEHQIFQLKAD